MKQFILNTAPDSRGMVTLRGSDFHYLARVRRVKPGDEIEALLPNQSRAALVVVSVGSGVLTLRSVPRGDFGAAPSPVSLRRLVLFQALPKGAKMDLVVRQAAETGVDEIVPFVSDFSQVKLPASGGRVAVNEHGSEKLRRWERIVREARQQSGSLITTSVSAPRDVDSLLLYWQKLKEDEPRAVGILLHQDPLENGTFHDYLDSDPPLVVLAIGPEGGFSPADAARFLAAGFLPLALGGAILRSETAALYGTAAIRIIQTEKASWQLKTTRPRSEENA